MITKQAMVYIYQFDILKEYMIQQPKKSQELSFMQDHDRVSKHEGILNF